MDAQKKVRVLEKQLESLILAVQPQGKGGMKTVDIGGIPFRNEDLFLVWIKQEIPPIYLFGCFVDVYSILDLNGSRGGGGGARY